jgi:hypothetical protein
MEQIKLGDVHPLFSLIPIYLGKFFQNIYDDPNSVDDFRIFADAEEDQLHAIIMVLTFWFFWSLDRLESRDLLSNPQVIDGLQVIWGFNDRLINSYATQLDSQKQGMELLSLWTFIFKDILKTTKSTGFFSMAQLHKAQMSVLRGDYKV